MEVKVWVILFQQFFLTLAGFRTKPQVEEEFLFVWIFNKLAIPHQKLQPII